MQGLVESRQLKDREGQAYTLCLLARRSRLHPGMRYIARGLNALASPGNEIECDQVLGQLQPGPSCDATACTSSHQPHWLQQVGSAWRANPPSLKSACDSL